MSIYKGVLKNEREEILKNYNITVSNNNISSNYQPNDSTGKFTLVLNPGESYNIKFEIDSNFINDTINVSSENSGFYFYSKSIDFSTNELVFLEELENITKESEMSDEVLIDNNETTIEANSQPNEITIEINKQPEEKTVIKSAVSKTNLKKVIKVKKDNVIKKTKTISFEKPLLLTKIIKYKPTNTKSLFLNKLHNSKIKIITMMPPGASK